MSRADEGEIIQDPDDNLEQHWEYKESTHDVVIHRNTNKPFMEST